MNPRPQIEVMDCVHHYRTVIDIGNDNKRFSFYAVRFMYYRLMKATLPGQYGSYEAPVRCIGLDSTPIPDYRGGLQSQVLHVLKGS